MALSMDLKVYGQYGSAPITPDSVPAASGSGNFSQVFSAACQAGGGTDYESCFRTAAETYQVPESLLKAVAKVESNFTADAVSRCGAQGIMQLMPTTAQYLGVSNSFDPAQNIMGGAKYLRQMLDRFDGDVSKALAAYNAGPGTVQKCGGVPQSVQGYVDKVLGYAGGDVSVPVSAGLTKDFSFASDPSDSVLSLDELAELALQVYASDGVNGQESARLLVLQFLTQREREDEEEAWNMLL